jgi:endonuclease/exonuclease/phosphatase family metal-dependent hydrolase
MKLKNKPLKSILIILLIVIAIIVAYVLYVVLQFSRIEDNQILNQINNESTTIQSLEQGKEYTATTYNIGFGAYSPSYSFFMDTGVMSDGTPVRGKYGRAYNKDEVIKNTDGAIDEIKKLNPTFALFQEVDTNSTRSFDVNQVDMISNSFSDMSYNFAVNFHSSYLILPLTDPHGIANAGLLTLSDAKIDKAIRKSYPVSDAFPDKYLDLDRCFSVTYINVNNNKTLSLINSHMSAYDKGGKVRIQQLALLNSYVREEYDKGNYVIVGGDFNHALGSDVATAFESQMEFPSWVKILDNKDLDDCISIVKAENRFDVSTCRSSDIPWESGVSFATVVDGFLVSDNVEATAKNIETNYSYSDHQPVLLNFILK